MASVLGPFGLRKRLLAAVLGRRRREAGAPTPAAAFSSLTAVPATIDADDADESSLDLVLANASDEPLAGLTATRGTLSWVTVDPAESVVAIVGSDEIEDNDTDVGNILVTVVDQETGAPMPNVAITAASDRPGNDTVTVEDAVTDANGQAVVTITSDAEGTSVVTITVDGIALTDTATFTVSGEAPAVAPADWFSDWSTQTPDTIGEYSTADVKGDLVGMDRKWNGDIGSGSVVVAATGLGFPSGILNVFASYWRDPDGVNKLDLIRMNGLAALEEGDERYFRFWFRNEQPDDTADTNTHPVQDGLAASSCNWSFDNYNNRGAGVYRVALKSGNGTSSPYPNTVWFGPDLDKAHTYRVEIKMVRTASGYTLDMRVFNESGALVCNGDSLLNPVGVALNTYCATNSFPVNSEDSFLRWQGGANDSGTEGELGALHSYQGGFAVRTNEGWIGDAIFE